MKKQLAVLISLTTNPLFRILVGVMFFWIILIVIWGQTIIPRHSIIIDGERYWFLADDMMISMRYARNFADGMGLVWNPGERIEGYTNFLWVLIVSFIHYLQVPDKLVSLYVIVLNLFLQLILLFIFFKLIREITEKHIVAFVLAASFLTVDISSMVWSIAGFEATLIAVFVTYAAYRIIKEIKSGEIRYLTFLFIGSIVLIRADGVVLAGLLGLSIVATIGVTKRNIQGGIIAAAPFVLHILFRYMYYGALLPNTATLKLFDLNDRIAFGLKYLMTLIKWYWPILLLILAQVVGDIRQKNYVRPITLLSVFCYTVYIVYIGGDGIGNNRFFLPIIPFIFVLGATSLANLFHWRYSALIAATILLLARFSIFQIDFPDDHQYLFRYSTYLQNWSPSHSGVIIGVYLQENSFSGDSIAVFPAGQAPYFSSLKSYDMLGKSDAYIAKLNEFQGNRPGHNKFDANYIMAKKPTYVFPGLYTPWPESDAERHELIQSMEHGNPWLYDLFTNEDFVTHCMLYQVETKATQALFQCKWP